MKRMQLDYDPISGITEYLEFADDKMRIVRHQDVAPILKQAKEMANEEDYSKHGMKVDQWHYARIPTTVLEEMKAKHNVDWSDKNDHGHKKFFSVLNSEYAAFKTTAWNHE